MSDIQSAEKQVLKLTQLKYMQAEVEALNQLKICDSIKQSKAVKRQSSLYRLDPFLDADGLICVGGRLSKCELGLGSKHPLVITKRSVESTLLIRRAHEAVSHCGKCCTLNKLREEG